MKSVKPTILVVDDDRSLRLDRFFSETQYRVIRCFDCEGAVEATLQYLEIGRSSSLLAFVDIVLPIHSGGDVEPRGGLGLMRELKHLVPDAYLVPITGKGWGMEQTTTDGILDEARRIGIFEYISKPVTRNEVLAIVDRAVVGTSEREAREDELSDLKRYTVRFGNDNIRYIISGDKVMQDEVIGRIVMDGPSETPVLIVGETGTGKELVARAFHEASKRDGFLSVNCAAIPESLIESELYGHEKGAFSGADSRRVGKFEAADGGSLLLDEVGDLSLAAQAKLLRVLQEKELVRIGGTHTIQVDVRVIAATNQNLEAMIQEGRFRKDLFYRLEGLVVRIPPLRERPGDIELIARYYLEILNRQHSAECRLAPEAVEALMDYSWPGNVRELQNVLRYGFSQARRSAITVEDLPSKLRGERHRGGLHGALRNFAHQVATEPELDLKTASILLSQEVFTECDDSTEIACEALGISPNTLNKYKRSIQEVFAALVATGFDEEAAARRLPDFGSSTFLRRRIRAFLVGKSDEELASYRENEGFPVEWLEYIHGLRKRAYRD